MKNRFYGKALPGVKASALAGHLIVLEGGDGSGRTTQLTMLRDALGRLGYPTAEFGLKRSELVGEHLQQAMQTNILCHTTLSLFYATDFYDQLERQVIPALRAGFVVIADRYIYTLIARDIVRGGELDWNRSLYAMALVPDMVVNLKVAPKTLAERSFLKKGTLDFWESGKDIETSGDLYECFTTYQGKIERTFKQLEKAYDFVNVNGERHPLAVHEDIFTRVKSCLKAPKQRATARASAGVAR